MGPEGIVEVVFFIGSWVTLILLPAGFLAFLTLWFLALPRIRAERARFFLDLLAEALRRGRHAESVLVSMSRSGETALGPQFHLLAAHLESGMGLIDALGQVPRFLPPQVAGMLRAGARTGNLVRVLPACRRTLADVQSKVQAGLNYHLVIFFLLNPVFAGITVFCLVQVFPVYGEIATSFGMPFTQWLKFSQQFLIGLTGVALSFFAFFVCSWVAQFAGPWAGRWLQAGVFPLGDWAAYLVPWRRLRMLRDFLVALAALLDGGVPEAEAMMLAARATGNAVFRMRALRVLRQLEDGLPLQEAIRLFDPRRELTWRIETALRCHSGFSEAMNIYALVLESRAFRSEQIASQALSTAVVLINGLVALVLFGTFILFVSRISLFVSGAAGPVGSSIGP